MPEGVGIDPELLERFSRLDVQIVLPAWPADNQVTVAQRSAPRARRKRVGFSQRELNRLAELAEKHPGLTIQRVAPDGSQVIIGKEVADGGSNGGTDNPWDSVLDADQKRAS